MNLPPAPVPVYLQSGSETVFATFHPALGGSARDTAVLLCPPFGWDEVCAYRSLLAWARHLAQAGYGTARISFPATGDSAGLPRDPDRLTAWRRAVGDAADWLRATAGAPRLAAVGIGLGGMIAHLAVSDGAAIDDLALWGTPARGRALIRQLRTFSKLEAAPFYEDLEPPPPLPAGELEAGGFLLSAETVQALEAIDLSTVELPGGGRRVLALGRDGIAFDARLRAGLERCGATVTLDRGDGFGAMTSHPQRARPPMAVIERVTAWLDEASTVTALTAAAPAPARPAGGAAACEIRLDPDTTVTETAVEIRLSSGTLRGVLVQPSVTGGHGLCAVLLNAGAVRRIGPNRLWVEIARRWAARGVPTLRLDVEGLGDSDGNGDGYWDDAALYVPTLVPQVLAAVDYLHERGVGERFALGGMCAGAYWSFHAALRDPRVCTALMVNPRVLIWNTGIGARRDFRTLLSEKPSLARIRRAATGPRIWALLRWLAGTPQRWLALLRDPQLRAAATEGELDAALEQFRRLGKRALLLFSEREPLHAELVRTDRMTKLERWPTVTVEHVRVRDHTLRPLWAQIELRDALDRALDRELELARPSVQPGPERTPSDPNLVGPNLVGP